MKKIVSLLLVIVLLVCAFALSACEADDTQDKMSNEKNFHFLVDSSKFCLDNVAGDIYEYWFDAIFENKYGGDIDEAVNSAYSDNESFVEVIKNNDEVIQKLYNEIKDGELSAEVEAVMQAYNDYYTLVMKVSGTFWSYHNNESSYSIKLMNALSNLSRKLDES